MTRTTNRLLALLAVFVHLMMIGWVGIVLLRLAPAAFGGAPGGVPGAQGDPAMLSWLLLAGSAAIILACGLAVLGILRQRIVTRRAMALLVLGLVPYAIDLALMPQRGAPSGFVLGLSAAFFALPLLVSLPFIAPLPEPEDRA